MYPPPAAHPKRVYIQEQHPSILEHFEDFAQLLKGKRLAVFLDYDGEHFKLRVHSMVHMGYSLHPALQHACVMQVH